MHSRETVARESPNQVALSELIEKLRAELIPALSIPRVWLNEVEAGKYLSLSTHLLRKWRSQGGGPEFYRVGNRILYKIQGLNEWIEAHRVKEDSRGTN